MRTLWAVRRERTVQEAEGQARVIIQNVRMYGYLARRDGFRALRLLTGGRDPWGQDLPRSEAIECALRMHHRESKGSTKGLQSEEAFGNDR